MSARIATLSLALFLFAPLASAVAPTANLHQITWLVHIDLIDVGAGKDLTYYSDLIAEGTATATDFVKGDQGPFDQACCNVLETISVATFGTPGDGLDVPSSQADYDVIDAIVGASGSYGFLVDSLGYCGGPTTTAIGCAQRPTCDGDGSDDPDLYMVLTIEAYDAGVFGKVIAHERGHNACLSHATADRCQIMRSGSGGACLTTTECTNFDAGRNSTGGTCECHDGAGGLEDDGDACTEGAITGICSGGLCGEVGSDASVQLLAAGGPGAPEGDATDDPLLISGATGGWTDLGAFNGSDAPTGLAYATDRDVVYGVVPTGGDHELITIDPTTGAKTGTVGTLTGYNNVISLAYNPGATSSPSDDLLYGLDRDGSFEDLLEIDPDDASVVFKGGLSKGVTNGFLGLAYDSINDKLYASGFANSGIYEVATTCGGLCTATALTGFSKARVFSGLAFSPETGALYLTGSQSGPRTLYDAIDATTFATTEKIGVDGYTPGGFAAMPVPEPSAGLMQLAGAITLAALARRRARQQH
jgi:hypothetical protein